MPNKTIYVKDADVSLFDQAQEQWGESVSSMFAQFLRERVAKLTPEETSIVELMNLSAKRRAEVEDDPEIPAFVAAEYAEAEAQAGKALKAFRAGDARKTKVLFFAANTYRDRADKDSRETKELSARVAAMLGPDKPVRRKGR